MSSDYYNINSYYNTMKLYDITSQLCMHLFIKMNQYMFTQKSENLIEVFNNDDRFNVLYTIQVKKYFFNKTKYFCRIYNNEKKYNSIPLITLDFHVDKHGNFKLPDELKPL
jgi:hypothetical protein